MPFTIHAPVLRPSRPERAGGRSGCAATGVPSCGVEVLMRNTFFLMPVNALGSA